MNGRELALQALIRFRRDGAWPDLYLKKEGEGLAANEMALASALTYGVLEQRALLDFYLQSFSKMPLKKIMPQVLDAMRIAAYQLVFLQRIPVSAAINESIKLVKKQANPRAASFANGVLRSLSRSLEALPEPNFPDLSETLSVRYSHPKWLVDRLIKQIGGEACEAFLKENNQQPPVVLRVNTLKTSSDALLSLLPNANLHPYLPDALICESVRDYLRTDAFREGLFSVQDSASQLCVHALQPQPGETLLDLCAAPGGKSILAAQMMGCKGKVLSFDLHPHRADLIRKSAEKMGVTNLETAAADSTVLNETLRNSADAIICDVPCSGIGIIRKKPDIRYKKQEDADGLPKIQLQILLNALDYLKPGGRVVYSTCTVLEEENQCVLREALAIRKDCELEEFVLPGIGQVNGAITLWPQTHGTDGFFLARIKKKGG
jgi:16S rRNA (cytosine967-C5)-methyltransferase